MTRLLHLPTRRRRGFTLVEIVIAMLLLSLGVMGCIALFFLGVHHSRDAIQMTRATILAQNVRDAMIQAMRFPIYRVSGGQAQKWFRFEIPDIVDGPILTEAEADLLKEDTINTINGFYFQISDEGTDLVNSGVLVRDFRTALGGEGTNMDDYILDLPREAMDKNGAQYSEAETWVFRDMPPYRDEHEEYDLDDTYFYSFRVLVRRSARYPSAGNPGPGDLLCCTVMIYRQYASGVAEVFETYNQYGQAKLGETATGAPLEELRPIYTFHFYLPGA